MVFNVMLITTPPSLMQFGLRFTILNSLPIRSIFVDKCDARLLYFTLPNHFGMLDSRLREASRTGMYTAVVSSRTVDQIIAVRDQ